MKTWKAEADAATECGKIKELLKNAESRLRVYEAIRTTPPHEIPVYAPGKGQAIAIAMLSDVHIEERVDPEDVPGTYNVYTPAIAKKRLEQFAQRVVHLTKANRALTQITDLCLFLGGDIITGYLHDDNKESNWLPPLKAILMAKEEINAIIKYMLKEGAFERIIIPCTFGNHGRLTIKPRAKTAADTNLERMLYHLIAKDWAHEKRVTFHIAEGSMVYLDLYGFTCRFMHGDDVKYQGGTGGLAVPLLRAVKDWDKIRAASYTFLGHHHSARDFGCAIVNGSVIGYNAYAMKGHFPFEMPKQQYVLLDKKRGKSSVTDIWCDYGAKA